MSRLARRSLLSLAVAAILILVVDTVGWWLLTSRLEAEAAAWRQARVEAGYIVTADQPRRAGWPLRAVLAFPDVGVATGRAGNPDAIAWKTDEVRLVYRPWRPSEVTVGLAGTQTVQLGAAPSTTLQLDVLDLVVPLDQTGQAAGFVAMARRLQLPLPSGRLTVEVLWLQVGLADIHLSVSALTLPEPGLPLGVTVNSVDLQARSTVPLPPERQPMAAAAAWRDAGGQVVVDAASVEWGPLDVHATAVLSLDKSLQPVGSGTVRLTGYNQAIEALVRSGLVTRNNARVAGTLLGLMSHDGGNGTPQADLPFSLRDGVLMSGAIPLLRLPPLVLP